MGPVSPPRAAPARGRGTRMVLHLEIRLPDGTVALSTWDGDPLALTLGDGSLSLGLEALLAEVPVGVEERILAHGDDLFGPRSPENLQWLPSSAFPPGQGTEPGQVLAFETPGGQELAGVVLAVESEQVQVDLNHPLAGKSLDIRVRVLSVEHDGDRRPADEPTGQNPAPDLSSEA